MTVQRYNVFGWANPVEGGDGPFGATVVMASDYDALAARLAIVEAQERNGLVVCAELEGRLAEAEQMLAHAAAIMDKIGRPQSAEAIRGFLGERASDNSSARKTESL